MFKKDKKVPKDQSLIVNSQAYKSLVEYMKIKSESCDLGGGDIGGKEGKIALDVLASGVGITLGDGIAISSIKKSTIASWLRNKLIEARNVEENPPGYVPASKGHLRAALYAASEASKEIKNENYYTESLIDISETYLTFQNKCDTLYSHYQSDNDLMDIIKRNNQLSSSKLSSYIINLYKDLDLHQDTAILIQSLDSNITQLEKYLLKEGKIDIGKYGNGFSCLNIAKYGIARWLVSQLCHLDWKDPRLVPILSTAATINRMLEEGYFKKNLYVKKLHEVINIFYEIYNLCNTNFNNNFEHSSVKPDILITNEFSVFKYTIKRESELSKCIDKLYSELEQQQAKNANVKRQEY